MWNDTDLICASRRSTPINPRNLLRQFAWICDQAGLPHIRLHDLRHTVTTLLQANGTDLRSIMDTLGHSRLSTTADTYIHPTLDAQRRVADTLHRVLFGKEAQDGEAEPGQADAAES